MRILQLTLMTLAAVVGACDGLPFVQNDGGAIPRARFVNTVVALRRAVAQSPSAAEFARQKAELLSQTGVTDKDLQRFIEVHGADAIYMSAVWDTVAARLERPQARARSLP
jgi:hypothetical protein